jgi:hypothetical protein
MKTARQVVQVVGCVSFLLMGVGTLSHALGQSSAPKVDNPCKDTTKYPDNFSKLACVITHKFPSTMA